MLGLAFGTALNITSIALSAVAFAVSWKQRSYLVAGLLVATGVIYMLPALTFLVNINFAFIEIPGPTLGVIFGLAILALGIVKSIKTGMAMTTAAK